MKKFFGPDRLWPTILIIGMTVFIAVNLAFVTMAFRNKPQLVTDNYYAEGFNLREIADRKAASDATGWHVVAQMLPRESAEQPLIQFAVTDARGAACDSLQGSAAFYRPSDKSLDVPAQPLRFVGAGKYLVVLPRALERGAWQANVQLARNSRKLEKRVNLFVER